MRAGKWHARLDRRVTVNGDSSGCEAEGRGKDGRQVPTGESRETNQ